MEDQDGALLDGEPPEGPFEQVAIVHGQVVVEAVHGPATGRIRMPSDHRVRRLASA